MQGMLVIFSVGCMVGAWMFCGTVPYMVYWGLQLVNPALYAFKRLSDLHAHLMLHRHVLGLRSHHRRRMIGIARAWAFP